MSSRTPAVVQIHRGGITPRTDATTIVAVRWHADGPGAAPHPRVSLTPPAPCDRFPPRRDSRAPCAPAGVPAITEGVEPIPRRLVHHGRAESVGHRAAP